MAQMKMSTDVLLTPSNVDMAERWRYSSMMVSMQELAEIHAASFGNSRAQLIEKGVVWVLARARIEMTRVPKMGETVRLITWPGQTVRALFPRYYSMEDEAGCCIGTAVTLWMLVDVEKHRMAMPSLAGVTMPDASGMPVPQPNPAKLAIEGEPELFFRRCAYSDLDVNHHMNNTRYAEWVCDLIDPQRLARHPVRALQINYIAEARPGEQMELALYDGGSVLHVRGKDTGTDGVVFEARLDLTEGEETK